jgi:V-type H+-transporting ATPase subunit d
VTIVDHKQRPAEIAHIDFKLQLTSTDYGNFLANETPPVSTSTIAEKATQRLVDEFNYIRSNAGGQLAKFLDYITCVLSS